MTSDEQRKKIMKFLDNRFPKAASYTDIMKHIFPGLSYGDRHSLQGGSIMKGLIKKGKVKQITIGYYTSTLQTSK